MAFNAGALAGANPYGAAIGAAAGVLNTALADTPTSVTSGSGSYQSGPFTIGVRQVGGKGNSAGATTASAQQTPSPSSSGNAVSAQNPNTKWLIVSGAVAAVVIAALFIFKGGRSRRR